MIRLLVDEPLSGSLNMSIDQALLQSAAENKVATLRIYRWSSPTVSLGYFQDSATRETHGPSAHCPIVRRASGGGAIVHDHEVTYSLALPADNLWTSRNRDLFDTVHRTIIECLQEFGVEGCQVFQVKGRESQSAPFLCFQRRATGDVVIGNDKVIGSAQRRLQNALLQHGSVLLARSECAPELPGITELCPDSACTSKALIDLLPQRLASEMDWTLELAELTASEIQAAKSIESEKFNNDGWTYKR